MIRILKYLLALTGSVLVLFLVFLFINYAPDKSPELLKQQWAYDNSSFVEIKGMPVHYRINGSGHPLVLIHGTGASLHTWERWTELLAADFKVISLDMPAFGLTGPNPTGEYSLEFYAQFLDDFLNEIGVDQPYIAGNSLGGGIAWRYAVMFPDKVKKLVLLDASGYPSDKAPPLAFQLAKSKFWSTILLNFTPKSLFEKSLKEVYYNDELVTPELIDRYYQFYLRTGNRQAFIDRVRSVRYSDPALIKTIRCPTLIIWGETDEWVPVSNAYKFEKDIPGAELIVYEKVGHLPMEEIPEQTSRDLKTFLQKNDTDNINSNNMEKLQFTIFIEASPKVVYQTMIDADHFRKWTAVFSPVSYFKGNWEKNSIMHFLTTDDKGNPFGMISRIKENKPNEFISIEHYGLFQDGKEITEGEEVDALKGFLENYTFTQKGAFTEVRIDTDVSTDLKEFFQDTWPKALEVLKGICEGKET